MTWILKLLTGTGGGWILAGALLAVAAASAGTAGTLAYRARGLIEAPKISAAEKATETAKRETAQCVAIHQKARADGAEKALTGLETGIAAVGRAMDQLALNAAARKAVMDSFYKEIANVPSTRICAGSAAELAFRRSVSGTAGRGTATPP